MWAQPETGFSENLWGPWVTHLLHLKQRDRPFVPVSVSDCGLSPTDGRGGPGPSGAAEGSSLTMGSSVLCLDSQQLGNCCPAGRRTSGWDTPTAVYPSFLSLKHKAQTLGSCDRKADGWRGELT